MRRLNVTVGCEAKRHGLGQISDFRMTANRGLNDCISGSVSLVKIYCVSPPFPNTAVEYIVQFSPHRRSHGAASLIRCRTPNPAPLMLIVGPLGLHFRPAYKTSWRWVGALEASSGDESCDQPRGH